MANVVTQRLSEYFSSKNLTIRKIAQILDMQEQTFGNKMNGTRRVDIDTLENIALHFEDISAEWLLRGEGEMLRTKESTTSDTTHGMADNSTTLMVLQAQRELIEMQRELIEMQREKSAELTKLLADNKKISTST